MNSYQVAGNAPNPVHQPPVAEAMCRLRANREELHNLIERLEDRLTTVLRPKLQSVGDNAEAKAPHESPLHGAIEHEASDIRAACSRIDSLLDRLTL